MDNNFSKFKKIVLKESIIKCTLIGLSLGIIVFSTFFLLDKRNIIDLNLVLCILLGVAAALISFVSAFSILKPKDINVAKRIDKSFDMNEKVQTMVAFKDVEGDMVLVQREDTKEKLSKIETKKFPMKFNFFSFLVPVVAIALLVTAIAVPAVAKEDNSNTNNSGGSEESSEEIIILDEGTVEWYIAKVEDIIQMVQKLDIKEEAKTSYINDLNDLIEDIINSNNEYNIIQDAAESTVNEIKIDTDVLNTNNDIYSVLDGHADYHIRTFGERLNALQIDVIKTTLDNMCDSLQNIEDPTNPNAQREAIEQFQSGFSSLINEKIVITNRIPADDPLYLAIKDLCTAVSTISTITDVEIEAKFAANAPKIIVEATKQKAIQEASIVIIDELSNVFDLMPEEPDEIIIPDVETSGEPEEFGSESSSIPSEVPGGIGDDEIILGGEAEIYDPEVGYVDYGKVMDQYFAYINDLLSNGQIGQEFKELIDKYYNLLQMGIPSSSVENE